MSVPDDTSKRVAGFIEIGGCMIQEPKTGAGACYDSREGLVDFVRNRRRQGPKAGHPGHVCKVRAGFGESLLRESPGRYVLNRADVFQLLLFGSVRVSHKMQMFERTIWHLKPEFVVQVAPGASPQCDHFSQHWHVFRMKTRTDQIKGQRCRRVELENVTGLCRPNDFICCNSPQKASCRTEMLSL